MYYKVYTVYYNVSLGYYPSISVLLYVQSVYYNASKYQSIPLSARELFSQLVDGVIHLHANNIVHRDISLNNLLLTGDLGLVSTPGHVTPAPVIRSRDFVSRDLQYLGLVTLISTFAAKCLLDVEFRLKFLICQPIMLQNWKNTIFLGSHFEKVKTKTVEMPRIKSKFLHGAAIRYCFNPHALRDWTLWLVRHVVNQSILIGCFPVVTMVVY